MLIDSTSPKLKILVHIKDFNTNLMAKKVTLNADALLGVGHKLYVYTCRRTRFLNELVKKRL